MGWVQNCSMREPSSDYSRGYVCHCVTVDDLKPMIVVNCKCKVFIHKNILVVRSIIWIVYSMDQWPIGSVDFE